MSDRRLETRLAHLAMVAVLACECRSLSAATIPVTTSIDEQPVTNGNCTLREALSAAESNVELDACPAGSAVEADVIELLDAAHAWSAGAGFVAGGGPLVIRGPSPALDGCYVIVAFPFPSRFLQLLDGADLTIENVEIREGSAYGHVSIPFGGAILAVGLENVALTLRNVSLRLNRARTGGAIFFDTSSNCVGCRLEIDRSLIAQNVAEVSWEPYNPRGGGMVLRLRGDTAGRIVDSVFEENEVRSYFAGDRSEGGGVYAELSDAATLELRRVRVFSNSAIGAAGTVVTGGGMTIRPFGDGELVMEDVELEGNGIVGPASGGVSVTALDVGTGFSGSFRLDRVSVYGNDWSEDGVDVVLQHTTAATASARNVLVAAGARRAAAVSNWGPGSIALAHWTVTQHVDEGLDIFRNAGTGEVRLDNSILWQNGVNLTTSGFPTIDPDNNLIDVDPIFEDPMLGGFRLQPASPAVDLGEATHSGSPYDIAHGPRSVGAAPDAGAFERGGLFADGFESGDRGAWSTAVP